MPYEATEGGLIGSGQEGLTEAHRRPGGGRRYRLGREAGEEVLPIGNKSCPASQNVAQAVETEWAVEKVIAGETVWGWAV